MRFDIRSLEKIYDRFKEKSISSRVFKHAELLARLKKHQDFCAIDSIGRSVENREIFKLSWGVGQKRVMIWSQMHGDETTGTAALFDILNFFQEDDALARFLNARLNFTFIPMLNPDGAEKFQRRNAVGIDLNRDARALQSPEIRILFDQAQKSHPHALFNLHDQRSMYHVGRTPQPAVLSFLAPAEDDQRTVTKNRKKTMGLVACVEKELSALIPGMIGRYSDEFYPMATGDRFQQLGYPCALFEAGYYPNDRLKQQSRKYNALAILAGFYALALEEDLEQHHLSYFSIPENGKNLLDKVYRKVKIRKDSVELTVDIGLTIEEKYDVHTHMLHFISRITEIGDLERFFAREEIHAEGKYYLGENGGTYPQLGGSGIFQLVRPEEAFK